MLLLGEDSRIDAPRPERAAPPPDERARGRPWARSERMYAMFRARFGPEVLAGLDGQDLLLKMHGRGYHGQTGNEGYNIPMVVQAEARSASSTPGTSTPARRRAGSRGRSKESRLLFAGDRKHADDHPGIWGDEVKLLGGPEEEMEIFTDERIEVLLTDLCDGLHLAAAL
jgi:hypothetical protein